MKKIVLKKNEDLGLILNSVHTEYLDYINQSTDLAHAFISGLCAGFTLGKDGDALELEATEELICKLIVSTMDLRDLFEVINDAEDQ